MKNYTAEYFKNYSGNYICTIINKSNGIKKRYVINKKLSEDKLEEIFENYENGETINMRGE